MMMRRMKRNEDADEGANDGDDLCVLVSVDKVHYSSSQMLTRISKPPLIGTKVVCCGCSGRSRSRH